MNAIYCLNTFDEEKIDQIFLDIKNKIIETKILTPEKVLIILNNASMFRNRYLKSYIYIFKRIYYEYIQKPMKEVREIYNYLLYKEYEIIYDDKHQENFKKYEEQNYSWDVHKKDTIFWAIMNDDKKLFEEFLARDDFNASIMIYNELYQFPQQSLISLCCYHGAAECDPETTADCLQLSFYGGDIDIINKCLKHQKLEQQHMRDLIFMHHNDFLNLFLPEFDLSKPYLLENYLLTCTQYNNLEAFISYLYKSNDINTCFIYSSAFNLPSLCEYLIKNGADINAKDKK
ncbi:hypothetical protein TVAG_188570 [Trichomonas vaginalis G3]|uniref:DUF3447 domain-containing protein n=1 Tax=Trichomonas vaginalis (strain ATCC PRA-98 / G3) TaxID=412133 RepID=A2EEX2_TRIV3|nr:protein of unknown function (DUF3447) [Trichomonas vaginalis G3]EAY08770.1 hypothetical protein TVAG_188570 [Trichomonas vaginalis G3]KAI5515135.1 protein of unknown function (DUF3447) [Trichomonas vaginalis G3]|eukprot:XP_001320993.1 hypothetical protein [Trichomonas vaginalis G3]